MEVEVEGTELEKRRLGDFIKENQGCDLGKYWRSDEMIERLRRMNSWNGVWSGIEISLYKYAEDIACLKIKDNKE